MSLILPVLRHESCSLSYLDNHGAIARPGPQGLQEEFQHENHSNRLGCRGHVLSVSQPAPAQVYYSTPVVQYYYPPTTSYYVDPATGSSVAYAAPVSPYINNYSPGPRVYGPGQYYSYSPFYYSPSYQSSSYQYYNSGYTNYYNPGYTTTYRTWPRGARFGVTVTTVSAEQAIEAIHYPMLRRTCSAAILYRTRLGGRT